MGSLIAFLQQMLAWLVTMLLWVPHKLYGLILAGLGAVIAAIPVPGFMLNVGNYAAGLPSGVAYFAQSLQLPLGLSILVTAYVLRFCIRRIPIIG
jgi:hypothetical protein